MLRLLLSYAILTSLLPLMVDSKLNCSTLSGCENCFGGRCRWCLSTFECVASKYLCSPKYTVLHPYNCPNQGLPCYDETFVRTDVLHTIAAVNSINNTKTGNHDAASQCVAKLPQNVSIVHTLEVPCNMGYDSCASLIALDYGARRMLIAFRTSSSKSQAVFQIFDFVLMRMTRISEDEEHVLNYYYEAFFELWRNGLRTALNRIRKSFANFEIVCVGHSLGGALSLMAGHHISKQHPAVRVHVITFSAPRVGDVTFVSQLKVVSVFRITHNRDWVNDFPFRISHMENMVHHAKYEVFYGDSMDIGAPFTVCSQAEDFSCSMGTWLKWPFAHVRIFENLNTWYEKGCSQ